MLKHSVLPSHIQMPRNATFVNTASQQKFTSRIQTSARKMTENHCHNLLKSGKDGLSLLIVLDLTAVFDTVDHSILIQCLEYGTDVKG